MKFFQNLIEHFELPHLFLSIVFVGMGLLFSYIVGIVTTLECARPESGQTCNLERSWMGLVKLTDRPLRQVHSAWVEENCDDDGCTYRVMLETDQGQLPLGTAYSSGSRSKEDKADLVNAFVKDSSISRVKVQDGGGLWLFIPLLFIIIGVGLVARPLFGLIKGQIKPEGI
jgi:hypothetical protein